MEGLPDNPLLDQLSLALEVSQVFALPLTINPIMARRYRMTALAFAMVTLVHFPPYSWLYQSLLYVVLAGVPAIGLFIVCRLLDRRRGDLDAAAWAVPLFVSAVLTAGSVVSLLL